MSSTFYAPYNQVVEACQQVGLKAACAKWMGVTGESINTLEAIALNRIMLAWNDTSANLHARNDLSGLSGWIHVTAFNALSEHSRFLKGSMSVDQMPEDDTYDTLFSLNLLLEEKDRDRAELVAVLSKTFPAFAGHDSLQSVLNILHRIIVKYTGLFSRKEWDHINRLATSYHPNKRIVEEVKNVCVHAFRTQNINKTMLKNLHAVYLQETGKTVELVKA